MMHPLFIYIRCVKQVIWLLLSREVRFEKNQHQFPALRNSSSLPVFRSLAASTLVFPNR